MLALPDRDVERVLAIIAHPDDGEFWVGGTIALWTDEGIQVTYCVLTDGSGGGFDPAVAARWARRNPSVTDSRLSQSLRIGLAMAFTTPTGSFA